MYRLLGPPRTIGRAIRSNSLALLAIMLVCSITSVASATMVDYSTTGAFGSTSSSTATAGGITISFLSASSPLGGIDAPSSIGLGTVHTAGLLSGTFSDTFTLTVVQTIPLPGGSEAFGKANVSGLIKVNSTQATITFTSPLSVTIPGIPPVTYSLDNAVVHLVAPGQNTGAGLGNTTIQGEVATVPLPATANMGLAAFAVMGGLGLWRKWKVSKEVLA